MARLNEPPVSTDSFETLRKKLLRQNRDLAKVNNVRALRIRELENECACMLSENVELRGRIIELEKQVETNETRRIANHAMAIKEKLESQLTEWGTLIAGLGLEPPPKRHSPCISKTSRRRTSSSFNRPSPSQRRLRDVAKDIEDLGHISEHKSYPRMSMNPEQIRALRSEADSVDPVDSPELGPPPMSHLIEDEPVKIDSPRAPPPKQSSPSPKGIVEPPMALHSRNAESDYQQSPSPQKKRDAFSRRNESRPNLQSSGPDTQDEPSPSPLKKRDVLSYPAKDKPQQRGPKPKESQIQTPSASQAPAATPTKAGIKRKFTPGDEASNTKPMAKATSENQPPRPMTGGKSLKELSNMRKEERPGSQPHRKPLSAKSTNDDIVSPKKKPRQLATDEVIAAKSNLKKCKATQDQAKTKAKTSAPVRVDVAPEPEPAPVVATVTSDLATPLAEPELLAPNSPVSAPPADAPRGDTPPPADISSKGETSRPSRRSRGVVSYTEPNLRDKMRRPTKDMVDAVAGSRCSSHFELIGHDSLQSKRDSGSGMSSEPPASPLAGKGSSSEELPHSVAADRRHRPSAVVDAERYKDESPESIPTSDADLYEITTSSPPAEKQGKRRSTNRQGKSSRRFSTALDGGDDDDVFIPSERASSRRRSMMV